MKTLISETNEHTTQGNIKQEKGEEHTTKAELQRDNTQTHENNNETRAGGKRAHFPFLVMSLPPSLSSWFSSATLTVSHSVSQFIEEIIREEDQVDDDSKLDNQDEVTQMRKMHSQLDAQHMRYSGQVSTVGINPS